MIQLVSSVGSIIYNDAEYIFNSGVVERWRGGFLCRFVQMHIIIVYK